MTEKTTERGFGVYAEFTDSYGSEVRVQESSSAEGPRVWIFASHDPEDRYLRPGARELLEFAGFPNLAELAAKLTPSPHLSIDQAKRVRDALDAFIAENGG
jgi:hypothetical protein